jgi:hypothetical protein
MRIFRLNWIGREQITDLRPRGFSVSFTPSRMECNQVTKYDCNLSEMQIFLVNDKAGPRLTCGPANLKSTIYQEHRQLRFCLKDSLSI